VITARTFEAGGVRPVTLPTADVYVALSTGLVETVGNSPAGAIIFQWHTRLKQMIDLPMTCLIGYLVIDGKAFAKLAPADQVIVREEMDRVFARIDINNRKDNEAARAALVKQGIEILAPLPEEKAAWVAVGRDAIALLAGEGAFTPGMLKTINDALARHRASEPAGAEQPKP
jgi:TRAP-type C4-dicarboxylate transport system substrate-binding protein